MHCAMIKMYEHVGELAVSIWWIEKFTKDVEGQFFQNADTYFLIYIPGNNTCQIINN